MGKGTVYLIHFDTPLKHARHYLGFTTSSTPERRLIRHRKGSGSKLMRAVTKAKITWQLVRIWLEYSRDDERKLKKRKNTPKLCPICRGGM